MDTKIIIKVYSSGQLLEPPYTAKDNQEKDRILDEIKEKLKNKEFKVRAGLGEIVTDVVCVDIFVPVIDDGELKYKFIELNFKS